MRSWAAPSGFRCNLPPTSDDSIKKTTLPGPEELNRPSRPHSLPFQPLLAHMLDALFQHFEGNVGFFFRHHQRRTQSDRARPAT